MVRLGRLRITRQLQHQASRKRSSYHDRHSRLDRLNDRLPDDLALPLDTIDEWLVRDEALNQITSAARFIDGSNIGVARGRPRHRVLHDASRWGVWGVVAGLPGCLVGGVGVGRGSAGLGHFRAGAVLLGDLCRSGNRGGRSLMAGLSRLRVVVLPGSLREGGKGSRIPFAGLRFLALPGGGGGL